ncbi:MAG: polyprenol monophosphomannose synthase [Planctomycetaceae bacterium]
MLISLCTYNERQNLENLIPVLFRYAPDAHVVIIDDGSPDGTGKYADELAAENSAIRVLHRKGKQGLGSAILRGFEFAIEDNYEYVLNLDADFSHHPQHIPAMRECMSRADVAIGSRYIDGGGVEGWGFKRHFMSRGINLYAWLTLGLKTKDNSGSFRCYRVSELSKLDFSLVKSKGYSFQEEILYRLDRINARFEETPIYFANRRFGETKITLREGTDAFVLLFKLFLERLRGVPVTKPDVT